MTTEPVRVYFRNGHLRELVLALSLCLTQVPEPALGEGTDTRLVRFVCQAYSALDQKFLARVLVLDQTPAAPGGSGETNSDRVDGRRFIDDTGAESSTPEVPFRLRIYSGVSLVTHLSTLVSRDIERSEGADSLDEAEAARYLDDVERNSLAIGRTDGELVAALRSREASPSSEGERMDYAGTGVRTGNRFSFRPAGRYRAAKRIDIYLKVLRGSVDSASGAVASPEDGPYFCSDPVLVREGADSSSLCLEGNEGEVDLPSLAEPRSLVRRIQRTLAGQGFAPGPIDGIPGPRTLAAVGAWKQSRGYETEGFLTHDQLCGLLPELAR